MAETKKSKTPKVIQLTGKGDETSLPVSVPGIPGVQALKLVGSIREKGFSEESQRWNSKGISLPEPRVIPFPKARHRSEGPHWTPLPSESEDLLGDTEDAEEIGAEQMANLAKTIERKKKNIGLGNWREKVGKKPSDSKGLCTIMQDDKPNKVLSNENVKQDNMQEVLESDVVKTSMSKTTPSISEISTESWKKVEKDSLGKTSQYFKDVSGDIAKEGDTTPLVVKDVEKTHDHSNDLHDNASYKVLKEIDAGNSPDRHGKAVEQSFKPIIEMEEIDRENQAALSTMSIEEISEAQTDLMRRMKPEIVEMLKRRSREKSKRRSDNSAESIPDRESTKIMKEESIECSADAFLREKGTDVPHNTSETQTNKENVSKDAVTANLTDQWQAWSWRVEAVKHLRFLLDGSVAKLSVESADSSERGSASDIQHSSVESVVERDILWTGGDPAGLGYTIKEAVALVRSTVPGQRAVALQLIGTLLEKSHSGLLENNSFPIHSAGSDEKVDWQAVWAYMLGPDPKLVLTLRMALDDSHSTVVTACTQVLRSLLSYKYTEHYFDLFEILNSGEKYVFLAPIFRRKFKMHEGFLGGGFWKYSAKPSNMFPFSANDNDDNGEEEGTIADDETVAGQDVAAGLIRMQILPRIRYILEVDQLAAAEDSCLSIIISLSRHSPTAADAVMKCPRLMDTILHRYILDRADLVVEPVQIKALRLISVLCEAKRSYCIHFKDSGVFQVAVRHLFCFYTLDDWLKFGEKAFKEVCAALVEELRLCRIFICYGLCVSYFPDFYPMLCFWLSPPPYEKLIAKNVIKEFLEVSRQSFLVLRALAKTLPDLYSIKGELDAETADFADPERWPWSQAIPVVNISLEWFDFREFPYLFTSRRHDKCLREFSGDNPERVALLGLMSAVVNTLTSIFDKIVKNRSCYVSNGQGTQRWIPMFVPQVHQKILSSGLFSKQQSLKEYTSSTQDLSFFDYLCFLRKEENTKISLAATSCLQGIIELISLVDKALDTESSAQGKNAAILSSDRSVLQEVSENGLVASSLSALKRAQNLFINLVSSEWQHVQSIEMFGRGGPAPGMGLGWGAKGGGFWSIKTLLYYADARVSASLLELFPIINCEECCFLENGAMSDALRVSSVERLNATLSIILIAGPKDTCTLEKALNLLLNIPVMSLLGHHIGKLIKERTRRVSAKFDNTDHSDYEIFCESLMIHFKNQWLTEKSKDIKGWEMKDSSKLSLGNKSQLSTIQEEGSELENAPVFELQSSLAVEWAGQKLPIPLQWLLSPLSSNVDGKCSTLPTSGSYVFNIVRSGLFFILGVEAVFFYNNTFNSSISHIPLARKIHALSMVFMVEGDMFLETPIKDLISILQELYGKALDMRFSPCSLAKYSNFSTLNFQHDVADSYETFIQSFVDHFSATSFGDVTYGCQVAIYLRRDVETPIRLAIWNALANNQVLELLPTLEECCGHQKGYLYPDESDERMIEAYATAWVSGALDKARYRMSLPFYLALHHISRFLFKGDKTDEKILLRKKVARTLLLDSSRKPAHQAMMVQMVLYETSIDFQDNQVSVEDGGSNSDEIARRSDFLLKTCEGDSLLCAEVQKVLGAAIDKAGMRR